MLKKKYRLSSSNDFNLIYRHGRKAKGQYGMLIVLIPKNHSTPLSSPQFGIVVNKKVGNAVVRHKVARHIRSLIHEEMKRNEKQYLGLKFSYIAFEQTKDFSKLEKEFNSQIESLLKFTKNKK